MIVVGWDDGAAARNFRAHEIGWQPLTNRDEFHFRCDVAAPRVAQLRRRRARLRAKLGRAGRRRFDIAARQDPIAPQGRQPACEIADKRTTRVVHAHRRLAGRQRNLTHRHAHIVRPINMNFLRMRMRPIEIGGGQRLVRCCGHDDFHDRQEGVALPFTALPPPVSTGSGSKGSISIYFHRSCKHSASADAPGGYARL